MSAVIGDTGDGGTGVAETTALGTADLGGDSQPQPEEQQPVQDQAAEQAQQPEVDPTKLDLTQPEHIKTFRSSYDKLKSENGTLGAQLQEAQQTIEGLRASQGRGVYLSTDVPLEDFNPREGLTRMMEEEPEYYEAVASDFMQTHFWPEFTETLQTIGDQALDVNKPDDAEKVDALTTAWDVMSRRMSRGQLDGRSLYGILQVLDASPDLHPTILARFNALQSGMPMPQQGGDWQRQGVSQQQQQFAPQNIDAIAQQYGLDPAEPAHAQLIQQILTQQQERAQIQAQQQQERAQVQREIAQRDMRMRQMQERLEAVDSEQRRIGQGSTEEAERRAETRLNDQLETALSTDINDRFASAIPKDRPGLLNDIKTIARATLDANPDYKSATAKAVKWFKQAAAAGNPSDRDRWDKNGLDCLAVVSVHRAKAITDAAERLLGPIRRTVQRQNQKTAQLQNGRREFLGGSNVPPVQNRPPAASGDIQATRDAIKRRWAEQQGR